MYSHMASKHPKLRNVLQFGRSAYGRFTSSAQSQPSSASVPAEALTSADTQASEGTSPLAAGEAASSGAPLNTMRQLSATATLLHNEISVIQEGSRESNSVEQRLTEDMHRTMSQLDAAMPGAEQRNA